MSLVERIIELAESENAPLLLSFVRNQDWSAMKEDELNTAIRKIASYGFSGRSDRYRDSIAYIVGNTGNFNLAACALILQNNRAKEMVRQSNTSIHFSDASGRSPLHEAAGRGNAELVELFCTKGAEVNCKDSKGNTPMDLAEHAGPWKPNKSIECVDVLVRHGALLDFRRFAAYGDVEGIESTTREENQDVNALSDRGTTALFEAARNNQLPTLKKLLELGATPDARNRDGQTPLSTACLHSLSQECDVELIESLLTAVASMSIEAAVIAEDLSRLRYFVAEQPSCLESQHHESVLGYAIHPWKCSSLKCLLELGARPNEENWRHIDRIAGPDKAFVAELRTLVNSCVKCMCARISNL